MKHIKKYSLQLIALLAMPFLFAFVWQVKKAPEFLELSGDVPGKNNIRVALVRDPYGDNIKLAEDSVHNGKFQIRCKVDEVTPVSIVFYEGKTQNSYLVILEKGKVTFKITESGRPVVSGGKYNALLLAYHHDPEFIKADEDLWKLSEGKGMRTLLGTDKEYAGLTHFLKKDDVRVRDLEKVLNTSKDPAAKVMAAVMLELQPDRKKSMKMVESLVPKLGEQSFLIRQARRIDKSQASLVASRQGKMIGDQFFDFTAANLKGENLRLASVVGTNKYTLLQFWASWCGPCRKEIPLLKKLYKIYRSKGLEIVSFSIDANKNSWQRASEDEGFTWPNISDLKAMDSEVYKKYPINGIPANVIIGRDGKIVASNLLDQELEDKIAELIK